MKKTVKYLGTLLVMVALLTGCGKKNDSLDDAIEKTKDLKSAHIEAKIDASVSMEGQTVGIGVTMEGDSTKDTAHLTGKLSALGMEQNVEVYTTEKDGQMYSYTKTDGEWSVSKQEVNKDQLDTEKMMKELKGYKSSKKVSSDKKGCTKYEVVYDGSKLNELTSDDSVKALVGQDLKVNSDIKLSVYVKDGYVVGITMDLSDLLKDLVPEYSATAKIEVNLSNINKVKDVKVPEDVINSAKED